ncbi:MAG: nucleoside recognition protein [Tepidanaerobacteraceae bacterium]|nr:nucleoside recognition protein [Tepidanaerobacteraceae bacterium]
MQNTQKHLSADTVKRGLIAGADVTWQLARIVIPIYFIVTFLKHTPVLNAISILFSPLMRLFGLPGKAAIVLVLGNAVNLYAAIGAMVSLSLTYKEITVLSIMLSFCHSLPVETALAKKIGLSAFNVIGVRIGLAILSGIAFNLLLR